MPVQIAEIIAHGYIPAGLKKRDYMKRTADDSLLLRNTRDISNQRDEFLQKERITGETSRRWQRKDSVGNYSSKRGTIDN